MSSHTRTALRAAACVCAVGACAAGPAVAAPAVTVTAPSPMSGVLSGTAAFTASANAETVGVTFKVDGVPVANEDVTPPFAVNLNTATISDGVHRFTAEARNGSGQRVTSAVTYAAVRNRTLWAMQGGADAIRNPGVPNDWEPTKRLGYRVERVEVGLDDAPATVAQRVAIRKAAGIKVLLLIGIGRNFAAKTALAPGALDPARLMAAFKAWSIVNALDPTDLAGVELGNETSYADTSDPRPAAVKDAEDTFLARGYALLVRDLGPGLNGKGIPLLAQASRAGRSVPDWVGEMFGAAPDLASYVDAWTVHPYGPHPGSDYAAGTTFSGEARLSEIDSDLAGLPGSAGAAWKALPIAVTEFGVSSLDGIAAVEPDNYGWRDDLSYADAGKALMEGTACLLDRYSGRTSGATNRLWGMTVYQARNQGETGTDRERFFGAYAYDGETPKGSYTLAVQILPYLASYTLAACPEPGEPG